MFKPIKFDPADPNDQDTYSLDFTLDLDQTQSEIIVGTPIVTTSLIPIGVSNLTTTTAEVNGNIVSTFITGGVANTLCLVSFEITTSLGNVLNRSVILPIEKR
jgi:hypothetical protein